MRAIAVGIPLVLAVAVSGITFLPEEEIYGQIMISCLLIVSLITYLVTRPQKVEEHSHTATPEPEPMEHECPLQDTNPFRSPRRV